MYEDESSPVVSVTVAASEVRKGPSGEHVVYAIDSATEDGKTNRAWRRYKEFDALVTELVHEGAERDALPLPGKKLFGNLEPEFIAERQTGLDALMKAALAMPTAKDSAHFRGFLREPERHDWPSQFGAVDLMKHDLPHESSVTEWWYYNAHLESSAGRQFSAFVCFFRVLKHVDKESGKKYYAHALNWAITDVDGGKYVCDSLLDNDSPKMIKKVLEQPGEIEDPILKRAMMEVLDKGNVPLPDRMFNPKRPTKVSYSELDIDFEDATVTKDSAGRYVVKAALPDGSAAVDLTFNPQKPAVRHGMNGVVKGHDGDDMFYYFIPRNRVTGAITLEGRRHGVSGSGWYDHEFGGVENGDGVAQEKGAASPRSESAGSATSAGAGAGSDETDNPALEGEAKSEPVGTEEDATSPTVRPTTTILPATDGAAAASGDAAGAEDDEGMAPRMQYAWNWAACQLDNGYELTAAVLIDPRDGALMETRVVVVDRDGRRTQPSDLTLEGLNSWTSTRTFTTYPTRWALKVPSAGIDLTLAATFDDQEFMTVIAKPAFWEGRVDVSGSFAGKPTTGRGFVERNGFGTLKKLTTFFKGVGGAVRKAVQRVYPSEPTYEDTRMLVCSEEMEHYMEGVPPKRLQEVLLQPVREIADRGGKSWRSYGVLACVDIVGGDSRTFVDWLAMPEFMHVGSLIVDDIQDRSLTRRGGPCAHLMYGEALCINAGTAAYFQGQKLIEAPKMTPTKLNRMYDLYFHALRAGHAGQALDISGLDYLMPEVVETGDITIAEERILCIHRLKTAAPAGTLARMGAEGGNGTAEQVEVIGRYFEAIGLAFQIMDDVLNLRGLYTNEADIKAKVVLKTVGEDITCGKVTIPVVKAMGKLKTKEERAKLWATIESKPEDPDVVAGVIEQLEGLGAIEECVTDAVTLVENAWATLDKVVPDSFPKIMLRSFGWFVIERNK